MKVNLIFDYFWNLNFYLKGKKRDVYELHNANYETKIKS